MISFIAKISISFPSPDPLPGSHRGAKSVVVVAHVHSISTRGRADLSSPSCFVVNLEVIEIRLRRRVGIDPETVKDALRV